MRRRHIIPLLGSAVAWPPAVRAQRPGKIHQLAILAQADPIDRASGRRDRAWTAFFDELRRLGHEEGRNLAAAWYSSEGASERAAAVARQVTELKPDVIFSPDTRMAGVLKAATATIPIVVISIDPVGTGLATNLARPGGNVTGFSIDAGLELFDKQFELLKQVVPTVSRVAWLTPRRVVGLPFAATFRKAARVASLTLVDAVLEPPVDEAEYRRVFAAMPNSSVNSLWVASALENLANRRLIADLAIASKLPGIYLYRENVEAGGLMSYGNDAPDTFRRAAGYIDRILKGANPAELPFQQPTKFELVINLRTAKALGLTVPPPVLARADEVIE